MEYQWVGRHLAMEGLHSDVQQCELRQQVMPQPASMHSPLTALFGFKEITTTHTTLFLVSISTTSCPLPCQLLQSCGLRVCLLCSHGHKVSDANVEPSLVAVTLPQSFTGSDHSLAPDRVITLLHELGHALHFILSAAAGTCVHDAGCWCHVETTEVHAHLIERMARDPRCLQVGGYLPWVSRLLVAQ